MNFFDIRENFKLSHDGTESYVILRSNLYFLLESDNANAALYYVIQQFANSYVQLYEDQPISPDFAHRAKQEMLRYLDLACSAFKMPHTPQTVLDALNAIVLTYNDSKKIF